MHKYALGISLLTALTLGQASAATTVKIATISALSGPVSNLGLQLKNGTQLAVNEMKAEFAKAGMTLQLVAYDDQADPTTGTSAARRVIADKAVLGVVGPLTSGVAIPATQAMAASHLVSVMSTATNEKITDRGLKNVNRVCARDDAQGGSGGNYVVDTLKAKKVYVLNDKTPYGQGLAAEAEKAMKAKGATIVQSEGVAAEERDFTAVITKIQALKPDAIYFGGLYGQIGPFLKQLRDKGVKVPLMGGDGLDSPDLVKLAGDGANNVYYTSLTPDTNSIAAAKTLAANYKKSFGIDMQGTAVVSYDAAKVILQGILNAYKANGNKVPSRTQVETAVRKGTFKGLLTGEVSFDAGGDRTNAKMYIAGFRDGKRVNVGVANIKR
ncbi:branched-chain amino acid ABC transporter substrate-binding protein [Deinococcus fonticola]|uniref:branched-chain amino acid ABC transporter substrate-binding protein n=1 Tax=Deinococcus fonticola TaxID=2528713 RepID=UPI001074A761|nr:branched-chain amino acid ABC transporter substrate-binding protein [Deinococcus fonticola]